MQFEEKTIERKEIYQGPIFQVVTDQVELPAGKGQAQRDLIFHNGWEDDLGQAVPQGDWKDLSGDSSREVRKGRKCRP